MKHPLSQATLPSCSLNVIVGYRLPHSTPLSFSGGSRAGHKGHVPPPFLTSLNKTSSQSGCGLEQKSQHFACRRSLVVDFWSWKARLFHPFLLSLATMYVILSSINPWSEKLHWLSFKKTVDLFLVKIFFKLPPLFKIPGSAPAFTNASFYNSALNFYFIHCKKYRIGNGR